MLKSYFKIIGRNLLKNKLYTLINVIGLAIGIAAIVWGFQNYRYSFSYNNFHKEGQSIFRVLTKAEGSANLQGTCPTPLAAAAKNDFSIVSNAVRWSSRGLNIKAAESEPFALNAHFTDPSFFDLFNFSLLRGTKNLNDLSTVMITEKAAVKFFGSIDCIGKTLMFYPDEPYKKSLTVSGILKDPPLNSSLQFEVLTNIGNQLQNDGSIIGNDNWSSFADAIFVKLQRPSEAAKVGDDLKKYLSLQQTSPKDIKLTAFVLEPLSQVANHAGDLDNNSLVPRPTDAATYGALILGLLILLSACLNFANTTVSHCSRRLKEIGVRKVVGSTYRQIMFQQLFECACIVVLAMVLSAFINNFWLPAYNAMFMYINVTANYFSDFTLLLFLIMILVSVTLMAGAYPALYVSRFSITNIFRGSVKFGGKNLFSRVLLGLQVVISFITVIACVAFSRNSEFQRTYNFGYDKGNIIIVNLQNETAFNPVYDELKKIPGIDVSDGTKDQIGFSYHSITLEANGEKKKSRYFETGGNYLDVMSLKLVAGRAFNATGKADYEQSMLINEKLAFDFGWKPAEAIGKQIKKNDTTVCTVVGVLKDFTQNSLFEQIKPVSMCMVPPEKFSHIIVHAKPGSLTTVYDEIKITWARLYPMKPFRAYYQDEVAADSSRVNESIATIFFWFAIISVLMAATGMFALVSLSLMKKMREIAIRKVVGAGSRHIFRLVLKGYFLIFILSAGIGCYIGYTLSKLLMDMIFQINAGVSIGSITLSFICVLVISMATMCSKIWYAAGKKATDVLNGS